MPYLIIALDHEAMEDARERVRHAHRAYLASYGERLLSSGAILDEAGEIIIGGASLIDTESRSEAIAFEANDPYAKAGIRAHVEIIHWRLRWRMGQFNEGGHHPKK
ncbi:YciI family protein [Pseudomonas sp. UM16]|uniref:YciI family protein n=1 Tax=Pseudomonas sp. UM16 TaxID=3158962 RepID=UPI0039901569